MPVKIFKAQVDEDLYQEAREAAHRLFGSKPEMQSWEARMQVIADGKLPRLPDVGTVLWACAQMANALWVEESQHKYMPPEFSMDASNYWNYWDFYFADRRRREYRVMRDVMVRIGRYADGWVAMKAMENN